MLGTGSRHMRWCDGVGSPGRKVYASICSRVTCLAGTQEGCPSMRSKAQPVAESCNVQLLASPLHARSISWLKVDMLATKSTAVGFVPMIAAAYKHGPHLQHCPVDAAIYSRAMGLLMAMAAQLQGEHSVHCLLMSSDCFILPTCTTTYTTIWELG